MPKVADLKRRWKQVMSNQTKLANRTFCVGIHGVTGQQIDEGYLSAGTRIKNIRVHIEGPTDQETCYRFESLEGNSWFTQETYGAPKVTA